MKTYVVHLFFILSMSIAYISNATPIEYTLTGEAYSCNPAPGDTSCELTGSVFIEENPVQFETIEAGVQDPSDHWIVSYDFSFDISVENYGDVTGDGNIFKHIENGTDYVSIITINQFSSELSSTWLFHNADGTPYPYSQDLADTWSTLAPIITWMTPNLSGLRLNNDVGSAYAVLERVESVPEPSNFLMLFIGLAFMVAQSIGMGKNQLRLTA